MRAAGGFFKLVATVALGAGAASAGAVVFALALGAALAAPDLRAVLGATPCAAPCWHQITPGHTQVDDAVQEISADPAVADLIVNVQNASWWWNGTQAESLRGDSHAFDGRMLFAGDSPDSLVDGLALMSSLRLGDLMNSLGSPRQQTLYFPPADARPGALYVADFGSWQAFALLSCPLRPSDFWNAEAGFAFGTVGFDLGGDTWAAGAGMIEPILRLSEYCKLS